MSGAELVSEATTHDGEPVALRVEIWVIYLVWVTE
jgi:hypothetical protein